MGYPVVASRLGGVPQIVIDGETGFLVEPGDVGELHDRLALLLADPALATEMGPTCPGARGPALHLGAVRRGCVSAYRKLLEGNLAE